MNPRSAQTPSGSPAAGRLSGSRGSRMRSHRSTGYTAEFSTYSIVNEEPCEVRPLITA
jgi:hypothetical protein